MQLLNDKVTGSTLTAAEWDQLASEIQNLITNSGLSLSAVDTEQVLRSIHDIVGSADFYNCSNTANAYTLSVISPRKAPVSYKVGMRVRFYASATNSGASTINVAGLGVKDIYQNYGMTDALRSGQLSGLCELVFDGTNFALSGGVGVRPAPITQSPYISVATSSGGSTNVYFSARFTPHLSASDLTKKFFMIVKFPRSSKDFNYIDLFTGDTDKTIVRMDGSSIGANAISEGGWHILMFDDTTPSVVYLMNPRTSQNISSGMEGQSIYCYGKLLTGDILEVTPINPKEYLSSETAWSRVGQLVVIFSSGWGYGDIKQNATGNVVMRYNDGTYTFSDDYIKMANGLSPISVGSIGVGEYPLTKRAYSFKRVFDESVWAMQNSDNVIKEPVVSEYLAPVSATSTFIHNLSDYYWVEEIEINIIGLLKTAGHTSANFIMGLLDTKASSPDALPTELNGSTGAIPWVLDSPLIAPIVDNSGTNKYDATIVIKRSASKEYYYESRFYNRGTGSVVFGSGEVIFNTASYANRIKKLQLSFSGSPEPSFSIDKLRIKVKNAQFAVDGY